MRKFGETKLEDFQQPTRIGRGAYGQVYKSYDKKRKQWSAIKKIIIEPQHHGLPSTSIRQISLLRELENHPNIVKLKDVITEQKYLYLIFEYLPIDLKGYLEIKREKQEVMTQAQAKSFLKQILQGIALCHSRRVMHRDLKPANILIDSNHTIKIADFGLARTFSIPIRPYTPQVVTQWYRAPEILLGMIEYSTEIDIWAIGCIFAQMITGKPLFPGDNQSNQIIRIFRTMGTPNQTLFPGINKVKQSIRQIPQFQKKPLKQNLPDLQINDLGLDLLQSMLRYNPATRITAKEALAHKYFNELKSE